MEKVLPTIKFAGTTFLVDVEQELFRQVDNETNTISFDLLEEPEEGGMVLYFDRKTLNVYRNTSGKPSDVVEIFIPSFVQLDPVGTARKHNLPDDYFTDGPHEDMEE
jgi:hypothetical protein